MPERIAAWCADHGQPAPGEPGTICRVVLESLALRYRQVLENLEELTGRRIDRIHIVGGGSRNGLLNRFVADCTGRKVLAGPSEATAAGNILTQAMGAGLVPGLERIRAVVRESFAVEVFEPRSPGDWAAPYRRFRRMVA